MEAAITIWRVYFFGRLPDNPFTYKFMSYTIPSEMQEAWALIWFLKKFNLRFTHIPNETGIGGRAGFRVAVKKKREGMQPGFPDYLVFLRGEVLAIELKKRRKRLLNGKLGASESKTSPEQKEWLEFLGKLPYCHSYLCYGAEEAIMRITEHMKWHNNTNPQE